MSLVEGDTHRGDIDRFDIFENMIDELQETENYLIILGDVGLNFYNKYSDRNIKQIYSKRMTAYNMTMIAIRGNHEYRPEDCGYHKEWYMWEPDSRIEGWFWVEDEFPNLLFCDNFGQYMIGSKRFYEIGGAYSVDKYYRLSCGRTWVENEQLNEEEQEQCLKEICAHNDITFDYVLTHTCPRSWEPIHLFLSGLDQSTVDKSTEDFLEKVEQKITYNKWFFAHFHHDEIINDKAELLFHDIKELEI